MTQTSSPSLSDDLSRRDALLKLGLGAAIAYAAPVLFTLSQAKASGASGSSDGASGGSGGAEGASDGASGDSADSSPPPEHLGNISIVLRL